MKTLEEALAQITQLEADVAGLQQEKTALLGKRDELLGKLAKFKKFEAHADVDIDELLRIKELHESTDSDQKSKYEAAYHADKERLEKRLEARIAAIEAERKQEAADREAEKAQLQLERIKTLAISEFAKPDHGVFNPEQLYRLVGDRVRLNEEGKPFVGDEYKELSLSDFLTELRTDPDFQNQFKASGVTGSGSTPNSSGPSTSAVNPWKTESFNLTLQGKLMRENPALAKSLMTAAGK